MIRPSRIRSLIAAALAATILSMPCQTFADTIIDNSSGLPNLRTNHGWTGSGQSLAVTTDNFLNSFTFYADNDSNGKLFDVRVTDALNGGSNLFSLNDFSVVTGANTVNINQLFTSGSTIFVQFDYKDFAGYTLQFVGDSYAGGNAFFYGFFEDLTHQASLNDDLRFIARFSGGGGRSVPDTAATLALLGGSFIGLAALRRRFVS